MFPSGLPEQFAFGATYKMASKTRQGVWNLIEIADNNGNPQFYIRFDGSNRQKKEISIFFANFHNTPMVFDSEKIPKVRKVSFI